MKLLLLADFHLGARLLEWNSYAADRRNTILNAWREAIEFAVSPERGIDAVLAGGDLFDRPIPDPEDAGVVTEGIARVLEAGKPFVLVPGVYDGLYHTQSIYHTGGLPGGATVATGREEQGMEITAGGETLHLHTGALLPGHDPRLSKTRRGPGDGAHVGLFHARIDPRPEALAWSPPVFAPGDLEQTGLDMIVMGGDHNPRELVAGNTTLVVPGTPVGLRSREAGDRSLAVAEITPDGVTVTRDRCDAPPVVQLDLDLGSEDFRSEGALAAHLRTRSRGAGLLSARLHGTVDYPVDVPSLEAVLAVLPLPVQIRDETQLAGDAGPLEEMAAESSVRGQFVRELRNRITRTTDEAEQRVLERALVEGLLEFARAEALHVD